MTYITKQLNVETWTVDSVLDWLKGISSYSQNYVKSFEANNVTGRKLSILELTDLKEILSEQSANLNHQLTIFKSIHNLLQMKHDLNKETLHTLIFNTRNRIITIMNYLSRLENCQTCVSNDCERCVKYARNEIISAAATLALTYRRLISWLVRIPFTRLKPFEVFREEINNEMKIFLRMFRKRSSENFNRDIKNKLKNMFECCTKMLDFCDSHCENENGKIAVAFSSCYLEKVVLRRKSPEQVLGLRLTTLSDGIFTIAEIIRESAADECSHLNVEDDIIAINNQIIVGWSSENIIKLLEASFNTGTVWLVLRKMPKDHTSSVRQQKNLVFIYKNQSTSMAENNLNKPTHQRKLSFSDIFDLSEEFIMEDSSDEDEEDYEDFNPNKDENLTSNENLIDMLDNSNNNRKFSRGGSYEKNTLAVKGSKGNKNKLAKLANKTNKNRLIRSMQNLLSFDRSRSNSAEQSSSNNDEIESKNRRKKSTDETSGKSDLFKSLFTNKRWDFASNSSNKNSFESLDSPSTPNLIGIKKIDASKRKESNSSINECGLKNCKPDEQSSSNYSPCVVKPVSRKPPIDKNKVTYKIQSQKPSMQGWLYRKKPEATSAASSPSAILTNSSNMTSSITSNSSNVSSNSSSTSKNNLIRNQLNKSKWKKYWCVLTKDYITFHKNPDEKVPKDFLLLKDFEISKEINQKKYVFILFDKAKQSTHEFYTEQSDEFNEWYLVLNDLRMKLVGGDSIPSMSSSLSSSSGYDTLGFQNDTLSSISSTPTSNTFNRRNNLQLQLSTIIDNNNDQLNCNMLKKNNQQQASPTLGNFQLQYNNSSRESSPDYSNNNSKVVSRDSSPGLSYPYLQEQELSESDAEVYSLTLCPEKQELFKEIVTRNGNKTQCKKNSSSGSLASANLGTSTSIASDDSNRNNHKKASCSPTSTSSSISKFVYDYHEIKNPENTFDQQQRCNSLPGSLQACVGSFLTTKHKKSNSNMSAPSPTNEPEEDNANSSSVSSPTNTTENQTTIPVHLEYNNNNNKKHDEHDNETSRTSKFNHNLQNLLLQFQKNSLLPKLIKKNNPNKQFFPASIITPVDQSNSDEANSAPNSPNVSLNISTVNQRPQSSHYNYYYQQHSNQSNCSSPITPPTSAKAKTTQISVQLGPKGITKINTLNLFTPDQIQFEQTEHYNKTLRKNPMLIQSSNPTPNSPSVTYRTELTILPSSFNKNRLKNQVGKNNS